MNGRAKCYLYILIVFTWFIYVRGTRTIEIQSDFSVELQCTNSNITINKSFKYRNSSKRQSQCFIDSTGYFILRIFDLKENDEGQYSCEDKRENWKSVIEMHVLAPVHQNGSSFKEKSSNYTEINQNETEIEIYCEDNTRLSNKDHKWLKNGKIICSAQDVTNYCSSVQLPNNKVMRYLSPIITTCIVILLILLVIIGFVYFGRRNKELSDLLELYDELKKHAEPKVQSFDPHQPLEEQIDNLPYDLSYEIRLNRITMKKVISTGQYGRVYSGELKSKEAGKGALEVAVKGPNQSTKYKDTRALAEELRVMIAIGIHPNVLGLIGVVTENMKRGGDLYGIVECTTCNLKTFLKDRKHNFINELTSQTSDKSDGTFNKTNSLKKTEKTNGPPMKTSLLISFAHQIANGMDYLASKMCVHKDLAARNVLLRRNGIVRISGFGNDRQWEYQYLIRNIHYASPFKTMARESICQSRFTEKSDVWSYGILLWEIFTLGDDPFNKFETAEKLIAFYESGKRLKNPVYMPEKIANLMYNCWKEDPDDRPTFSICRARSKEILQEFNSNLFYWMQIQLCEENLMMQKYSEWRDGPSRQEKHKTIFH